MRPVERGDAPQVFNDYEDAKPFLVERLGLYCSYCERPIKTNLAVEHILPKSLRPDLREEWTNFLLGCVNCNSAKGNKPVDRNELLLPDQDNTLLAFAYNGLGQVQPVDTLSTALADKAIALLSLTGLDKFPDEIDDEALAEAALERWQQRSWAWRNAVDSHVIYLGDPGNGSIRSLITQLATATGFFSVWMTVFAEVPEMRMEFIRAFTGTSPDCFDDFGESLSRPNGHL